MSEEKALTSQQEKFAEGVANGKSQAEAYRAAYPKSQQWKQDAVWAQASRLMADSRVSTRVAEIRAELAKKSLWTREQSVKVLAEIAMAAEKDADRVRATAELNKMHGFEAPKRIEHSFADMTDEEIDAKLREVEGRLEQK